MRISLLPVSWAVLCVLLPAQSRSAAVVAGRPWVFPAGPVSAGDTPLAAPNGLAVGPDGTIYVADQIASVVVAIHNGSAHRFAGDGNPGYSGDGKPAVQAELNGPGPLAVGPDGSVYIADLWNYAIRRVAPDGTISTVAGNGAYGECADGAVAKGPCVSNTGGLAVDSSGNLYFSDSSSNVFQVSGGTVRRYFSENTILLSLAVDGKDNLYALKGFNGGVVRVTSAGTMYPGAFGSNNPPAGTTAIAASADGTLYAAYAGCHVLRLRPTGDVADLASACSMGDGFGMDQRAIATDAQGNVYVADDATQTVRQISAANNISTFAGNHEWYYSPDGSPANTVALGGNISDFLVLASADVIVASGGRVRRVTATGHVQTIVPFGQYDPVALALAPNGNILFADSQNCRIQQIDAAGAVTVFAGRGACVDDEDGSNASSAGLAYPRALAYDNVGNLYVATTGGVREIDTTHTINTFAGTGSTFQDNVPATQTDMDARSLTFDPAGNMYIGDFLNHRIRRVSPSGIITTVAGNGNLNSGGDDGPALSAPVGLVWSMAADPAGNLWFADGTYLRELTTDGVITTSSGAAWQCPSCLQNVVGVRTHHSALYVADWPEILRLNGEPQHRPTPRCPKGCRASTD